MPGCFAHIALVNVATDADALDQLPGLNDQTKLALLQNLKFCELGAVGPDYPYLTLISQNSKIWADTMHYRNTMDIVRIGIGEISKLTGDAWAKSIAWLFGYAAHVVADLTVHPVVQLRVGPYDQNKLQHRVCEMNQDVFIFGKLGLGNPGTVEHVKNNGLATCCGTDRHSIDPVIRTIWLNILNRQFPQQCLENEPNPDFWHRAFITVVDNLAEEGGRLLPFARTVAEHEGLVLPDERNLDHSFLQDLKCPDGTTKSYYDIFDLARKNIQRSWNDIGAAFKEHNSTLFAANNGNLDTGEDAEGRSIFWS